MVLTALSLLTACDQSVSGGAPRVVPNILKQITDTVSDKCANQRRSGEVIWPVPDGSGLYGHGHWICVGNQTTIEEFANSKGITPDKIRSLSPNLLDPIPKKLQS